MTNDEAYRKANQIWNAEGIGPVVLFDSRRAISYAVGFQRGGVFKELGQGNAWEEAFEIALRDVITVGAIEYVLSHKGPYLRIKLIGWADEFMGFEETAFAWADPAAQPPMTRGQFLGLIEAGKRLTVRLHQRQDHYMAVMLVEVLEVAG